MLFHLIGTFPTQRAISEGENSIELAEERRLCYVAMTRAKTYLIMTWRKEVTTFFDQGFQVKKVNRSRFLDSLMSSKKGDEENPPKGHDFIKDTLLGSLEDGKKFRKNTVTRKQSEALPSSTILSRQKGDVSRKSPLDNNVSDSKAAAKLLLRGLAAKREGDRKWSAVKKPESQKPQHHSKELKKKIKESPKSLSPLSMDSTLFYSIGSQVKHPVHGEGVVIPPPVHDAMLVQVKFESGMEMNFPITGSSLTQKFNTD